MKFDPLGMFRNSVGSANQYLNGDVPQSGMSLPSQMPGYSDDAGVFSRWLNPSQHENQELQNQLFMTDYENQWTEQMWQKSADWNSVGSQIQRAIDAGVNPNYVLGASATDQVNPMQSSSPSIPSGMSSTGLDFASSANALFGGVNHASQAINGIIDAIFKPRMNQKQLDQMDSIVHNNLASAGLSRAETRKIKKLLQPMYEKLIADKENTIAATSQIYKLIEKYDAEIENLAHSNDLIDAQTGETKQKRRLVAAQAFEKEMQNVFRQKFGIADGDRALTMLIKLVLNGKGDEVTKMFNEFISTFSDSIPELLGGIGDASENAALGLLFGENPFRNAGFNTENLQHLIGLGPFGLSSRIMNGVRKKVYGRY